MLCTKANLRRVLDALAQNPKYAPAMRSIGAKSEGLIFHWLKRSAAGDPVFVLNWPNDSDEPRQFIDLVATAKLYWRSKWESQLRSELSEGIPRVIVHEGEVQFRKLDPIKYRDLLELGCIDKDDIWERDENGQRIPLVIYDAAPAHLKIRGAEHLLGWREGPKTLDINQKISGGVMIIGAKKQAESALVADLRRRLAELEANGPANPHPSAPVAVGRPSDEPPAMGTRPAPLRKALPAPTKEPRGGERDHIGAGVVPPGGFKMT
jgi:hypothetical protein